MVIVHLVTDIEFGDGPLCGARESPRMETQEPDNVTCAECRHISSLVASDREWSPAQWSKP